MKKAQAFRNYIVSFGWGGISHLAAKIGKSVSYVQRRIKLLDLPSDVLNSISNSSISTSIAEELLSVRDNEKQSELTKLISKNRLSSRKVRVLVNEFNKSSSYDFYNETNSSAKKK
jgi:ParB family transcriptional regulator, chromosome partitioning protein